MNFNLCANMSVIAQTVTIVDTCLHTNYLEFATKDPGDIWGKMGYFNESENQF